MAIAKAYRSIPWADAVHGYSWRTCLPVQASTAADKKNTDHKKIEKAMSEDSETQVHQRSVELQVEYILNRKRLEMLIKPGHTYTASELHELVHLAGSVAAYAAVQAWIEEVTSTLMSKGVTAAFGETVANQILQQEVASIIRLAAKHEASEDSDPKEKTRSELVKELKECIKRIAIVTLVAASFGFISGFLYKQLFLCPSVDATSDIIALVSMTPVAR